MGLAAWIKIKWNKISNIIRFVQPSRIRSIKFMSRKNELTLHFPKEPNMAQLLYKSRIYSQFLPVHKADNLLLLPVESISKVRLYKGLTTQLSRCYSLMNHTKNFALRYQFR